MSCVHGFCFFPFSFPDVCNVISSQYIICILLEEEVPLIPSDVDVRKCNSCHFSWFLCDLPNDFGSTLGIVLDLKREIGYLLRNAFILLFKGFSVTQRPKFRYPIEIPKRNKKKLISWASRLLFSDDNYPFRRYTMRMENHVIKAVPYAMNNLLSNLAIRAHTFSAILLFEPSIFGHATPFSFVRRQNFVLLRDDTVYSIFH